MIGTSLLFSGSIAGLLGPGDIATPTAGYSLRPLSVSYSGAVVRVRRSGDDAEKDFNASGITDGQLSDFLNVFTESGHILNVYEDFKRRSVLTKPTTFYNFEDVSLVCNCIEESSGLIAYDALANMVSHQVAVYTDIDYPTIDDPSLVSPCNDGQADELNAFDDLLNLTTQNDGYVVTWYDQFGSNDATNSTAAEQPKIWDASTGLVTENGKPALYFDGDELFVPSSQSTFNMLHDGSNSAIIAVTTFSNGGRVLGNDATSSNNIGFDMGYTTDISHFIREGNGAAARPVVNIGTGSYSIDTQYLIFIDIDADNATAENRSSIYVNSGTPIKNNTSTNLPSNSNATFDLSIGSAGNNAANNNGATQEIIIYNTDQSANREAIEDNINAYYDIY